MFHLTVARRRLSSSLNPLRHSYCIFVDYLHQCQFPVIDVCLGICDFVPQFDQRTPLNAGYEVFADLWRRAARWMYITPNVQFISAQGLVVKVKKGSSMPTL